MVKVHSPHEAEMRDYSAGHLRTAEWKQHCSAAHSRFDGGNVDLLHRHQRLERTLSRVAALGECIGQHTRGDLPANAPFVLAPAALAFLPAIADYCVPVAVGLFLIVGRDLEGKGLTVLVVRPAIEADTGYAHDGEVDSQGIASFAVR